MYTKEQIKQNLTSNPLWIERALVRLYQLQTNDEQSSKTTLTHNGQGFNKPDSSYLSYCAQWLLKGNHLNQKHLEKCGKRLPKYWFQISQMIG